MDSGVVHVSVTSDKAELLSHRLSDSESESQSDALNPQLSSISSQSSLAELKKSSHSSRAESYDSPGICIQNFCCSPDASTIGPAASSCSSSLDNAETPQIAQQISEGSEGAGSLKADSELLDPWDAPFAASLPSQRCCML